MMAEKFSELMQEENLQIQEAHTKAGQLTGEYQKQQEYLNSSQRTRQIISKKKNYLKKDPISNTFLNLI